MYVLEKLIAFGAVPVTISGKILGDICWMMKGLIMAS
jgi:hypothetical protein